MEPYNHGNIYATLGILLIFSLIPLFLGPVEFFWILEDMGSSWREVCSTTDSWQRRPEMGTHFHFITTSYYIKEQPGIENRIKNRIQTSNKTLHPLLFLLFQPGITLRVMSVTLVTSRKEGEAYWRK